MTETDSPSLSTFLSKAAWDRLAAKLRLSPREVQILRALLDDEKELVIARRLQISPHTVHTHMERLHSKLSVRSQSALTIKILTTFLLMTAEPDSPLPPICPKRTAGRCPLYR